MYRGQVKGSLRTYTYLVGLGFTFIFLAVTGVYIYSYRQYSTSHSKLIQTTRNNDIQLDAATEMRISIRERTIQIWYITLTTDALVQKIRQDVFSSYGEKFKKFRRIFLDYPLSDEEQLTMEQIDNEIIKQSSELENMINLIRGNKKYEKSKLSRLLSDQVVIMDLLDKLILIQQRQNNQVRNSSSNTKIVDFISNQFLFMMIIIIIGMIFAVFIIRTSAKQSNKLAEANEKLRKQACHDSLTGLPNRILIYEQIQKIISKVKRDSSNAAVMYLDIDNFKPINDYFGHNAGDKFLQDISKKMLGILRGSDTLGRLGGDEFVIILPELESPAQVTVVAEKLLQTLQRNFHTERHSFRTSASIGICIINDQLTVEEIIQLADNAMYQAKAKGRNQFHIS